MITILGKISIFFFISKRILLKNSFKCITLAHKAGYKGKLELSYARESKKSLTEGDEVRPHAQDQSYKALKKISKILFKVLLVLKNVTISLPLDCPHQARGNQVPHT